MESVEVQKAKQTEEARPCRGWAEPTVWTERMLNALSNGVKGGVWYSLIDKVYSTGNLASAFESVKGNKGAAGVDNVAVEDFDRHRDHNLEKLHGQLKDGSYRPLPVKRVYIDKPGSKDKRPLGIPAVRDRVVQKALVNVLEPIFEKGFFPDSYGFRPGKGCKDALREVNTELLGGRLHVVDADIKGYFDSIDHDLLMGCVGRRVADGRVLELIRLFLEHEVMDGLKEWTAEEGTPQGGVLSPLLANIYLDGLDWKIGGGSVRMIRYADDFVILCDSMEDAQAALEAVREWCAGMRLALHPDKTRVVDMTSIEGQFDFLGYRFKRSRRTGLIIKVPRPKSLKSLREKIRKHTKRCNGRSLDAIIDMINPKLSGWYEYFKHSHKTVCGKVDGWVRMRLRSVLRKRDGRRGRGRGKDHLRYPNHLFKDMGLFSLEDARCLEVQSLR